MNSHNPKFTDFLKVMFRLIWAPLIIFTLLILLIGCQKHEYMEVKTEYFVIDSVWIIPPGKISVMQLDPLYCYEKQGKVHKSRERIKTGDTLTYTYLKLK